MGKKRILALCTAAAAAAACILVQAGVLSWLPDTHQRYLQHEREQPAPADVDGLACIHPDASSKTGYTVDPEELQTHLPLLEINTGGQEIPGAPYYAEGKQNTQYTLSDAGETTIRCRLKVRDHGDLHMLAEEPDLASDALIRIRGNSSRWFDKKSFALRTVNENGEEDPQELLGMEKHDSWVLHGPFLDKTLMRNYLGMNISGEIMDYTPDVRFCELVLDGEYQGVYVLMETVSRGKGRIDIRGPREETNTTGYFLLMELFEMHDTGNLSTYYYRDVGGKLKPCVWDFNNCSGNYSINIEDDYSIRKFVTVQAPWFWMMCKDEKFTDTVIRRYSELRKGLLSDQAMENFIDGTLDYLGPAIDRNYAVWGYSFDTAQMDGRNKLHPDERNPRDFDDSIEQLKDALFGRLHWLDEHIEVLQQYSHESAVKKLNP